MDIDHDATISGLQVPARDLVTREDGGKAASAYSDIMNAIGMLRGDMRHVDGRLIGIDSHLATIHERLQRSDTRLDRMELRIAATEVTGAAQHERMKSIETGMNRGFELIGRQLESSQGKFEAIDVRLSAIDQRLSETQVSLTRIYVTATVFVALTSILAPLLLPALKAALGLR